MVMIPIRFGCFVSFSINGPAGPYVQLRRINDSFLMSVKSKITINYLNCKFLTSFTAVVWLSNQYLLETYG